MLNAKFLEALSWETRVPKWEHQIQSGPNRVWVAEAGDELVGLVSFGPNRDDDAEPLTGEIWALYVHPANWSSGIGRGLWETSRKQLVADGYHSATLWVLSQNIKARRFYERLGFQLDPIDPKWFELGGEPVSEVRYRSVLAPYHSETA
jgi:ribosomal protein S18 acetylase RimI-like enzyme